MELFPELVKEPDVTAIVLVKAAVENCKLLNVPNPAVGVTVFVDATANVAVVVAIISVT